MKVIKEKRFIAALNRNAYLYIGLPNDYEQTNQSYPVLYMHDGQNVFFESDAFIGKTWEVKEAYESDSSLPKLIIVALSSAEGDERLNEYGPFAFDTEFLSETGNQNFGGQGDKYLKYLVNELKPEIDRTYRTINDPNLTSIMGASMGGVISLYAALKYPDTFRLVASLSGSFFVSQRPIIELIKKTSLKDIQKIYMDTGDAEDTSGEEVYYIVSNLEIFETLKKKISNQKLEFQLISEGKHSEVDWAKRFPKIIKTLYP